MLVYCWLLYLTFIIKYKNTNYIALQIQVNVKKNPSDFSFLKTFLFKKTDFSFLKISLIYGNPFSLLLSYVFIDVYCNLTLQIIIFDDRC